MLMAYAADIAPAVAQQLAYANTGPFILRIDPFDCTEVVIGEDSVSYGDIALTPDRRLYGVSYDKIFRIDTATAEATLVTTLPFPFNAVSLLAWDNERLLFESWDSLCVINLNGEFSCLGHIGYVASGDLTWYKGDLYMTAGYSALIRIRLNVEGTGIAEVDSIGTLETTYGSNYGVATVRTGPCDEDLRMIIFDVFDAYFVNPATANLEPICLGAFTNGVDGAATTADTESSAPRPTFAEPNVFTPNGDGINDLFISANDVRPGTLSIYNRWGQEVHQGPIANGWDGRTSGGEPCAAGVYFYEVRHSSMCIEPMEVHGNVTLLR